MFMSKLTRQVVSRLDYPVVETASGKVRGIEKEGGFIFRGVPYAQAKRFQLPEDPTPWEGVKECLVFGCDAPLHQTRIAKDQHELPHYYSPQDENCQNLNIWTQHLDKDAKKPVLVWLHGGGFGSGAAMEQLAYDGENLSHYGDIVFVSVNFRLNILGCLDLSAFGEQYQNSCVCSLADLVKSLEWVQRNIAVFGGDPGNVTLLGHAGGALEVIALLQTPSADGLYHKASVSSGLFHPFIAPSGHTRKGITQRLGQLTAQELGLDKDSISKIDTVPYWYLSEAAAKAEQTILKETGLARFHWQPVADDVYYYNYEKPSDLRPQVRDIPIMLGIDMGDSSSNSRVKIGDGKKNTWSDEVSWRHLHTMYGDAAETIVAEFQRAYPGRPICDALFIDRKTRHSHFPFIDELAERGVHLWNWMFTLELPINSVTFSMHCIDNAFITRNAEYFEATYIPGVTEQLQDVMADAWIAFARTGSPQTASLPDWPEVRPGHISTMLFGETPVVRVNHDRRLQELMEPWKIY